MSEPIQIISQGNYILQGTVATSAGIIGDGSTQNPLRADETVLFEGTQTFSATLSESVKNFDKILIEYGPNNYFNVPAATFFTDKFSANDVLRGVHLEFVEHNGAYAYCFPKSQTFKWNNTFDQLYAVGGIQYRVSGNAIQNELTGNQLYIRKVIGINRISG